MTKKGSIRTEVLKTLLLLIPIGKVTTYKSLAKLLNTNPRVVGYLLSKNDELIIIPCHRVIKSDGSLGGYKLGVKFKKKLLELEGVEIRNDKVKSEFVVDLFLELIHPKEEKDCDEYGCDTIEVDFS